MANTGTSERLVNEIAATATYLRSQIDRDFVVPNKPLRIDVYGTHSAFAAALWRARRERPQTAMDGSSQIVRGVLLLGPLPDAYLRHNLAHILAEWAIDRLTGNRSDALPANPWLYDGLAEVEAYRYQPAGMRCSAGSSPPFSVTSIRTARRWLAIRAGPWGSMEYCLAYLHVRAIVRRFGWPQVVRTLHAPDIWHHVPADWR